MKRVFKKILLRFSKFVNEQTNKHLKNLELNLEFLSKRLESIENTNNLISRSYSQRSLPIKVIFLAHHATSWLATKPVVDYLSQDPRFKVIVISLPHFKLMAKSHQLSGEEEIHEMLINQGIDHFRIRESEIESALNLIKLFNPDFIFRQTPWSHDMPGNLDGRSLSFSKLCYIPYGYMTAAIEDKQFNQDFHHYCHCIYWPDEIHKSLSEKYSKIKALNCKVSGYPKFDHLTSGIPTKWPLTGDSNKAAFKLIWAPHYSFQDDWLKFGAFPETSAVLLQIARSNKNIQIVMRPHPAFLEYIDEADATSNIGRFVQDWVALENTGISREYDYTALFKASDALLTDGLSFLSEFQLFNKPTMFYEREDSIGFNDAGKQLLKGLYRIQKPSEIEPLINRLTKGEEDPLIVENRIQVASAIHPFPQQAASRIAEDLFTEWSK